MSATGNIVARERFTDPNLRETKLGDRMVSYLVALARQAQGTTVFRTGTGRIERDLMIHWPTLDGWEDEAREICARIADTVSPLAKALYAQAVEMSVLYSWETIAAPQKIDAMATYIVFDALAGEERAFFLAPERELPDSAALSAPYGVAVLCKPLNYRYHTIKDDREHKVAPRVGMYELPERMINALMGRAFFTPDESRLIAQFAARIEHLPAAMARYEARRARAVRVADRSKTVTAKTKPAAAPLVFVTSLSALPPPVRALEKKLMAVVQSREARYSADLRQGLREVAQALRQAHTPVLVDEAARRMTRRPKVLPVRIEKAVPLKLQMRAAPAARRVPPVAKVQAEKAMLSLEQLLRDPAEPRVATPVSVPSSVVAPVEAAPKAVRVAAVKAKKESKPEPEEKRNVRRAVAPRARPVPEEPIWEHLLMHEVLGHGVGKAAKLRPGPAMAFSPPVMGALKTTAAKQMPSASVSKAKIAKVFQARPPLPTPSPMPIPVFLRRK